MDTEGLHLSEVLVTPQGTTGLQWQELAKYPPKGAHGAWGTLFPVTSSTATPGFGVCRPILPHQQWLFLFPAVFHQQPALQGVWQEE